MSLAEYVPTAWTDYADSPDLEASFLNHIELGIDAVTDELIAFEAWAAAHYQPVSAELTAIAGLSSPGYVRRTGPGTYVTVASIPQADVAGGPFLPLAAGAANPLTGELYASQGVRVGSNMLLRDLPLWTDFGAVFGTQDTPTDTNYLLAFHRSGSQAYFNATSVVALDINGNDMVLATASGVTLAGATTLSALGAGFVRANSAGLLSSSALVAGDLPGTIASDTTGSAARWTTARTLTIGATGKAVDGSTNVSWSLAEIGAAPAFSSGAAGLVWATPAATAGVPSLRVLAASDIPSLDASKITTGTLADARIASSSTWNAKLSTVTADATSRAANTFYAAPSGAAGTATFRAIVAADIPTLNQSTTGSAAKWTTARSISMTGDVSWTVSVDGSANATAVGTLASIITAGGPIGSASVVPVVTWDAKGRLTSVSTATITPAAIGALASGGTAVNSSALGGVGLDYFVQGNGSGTLGHRTTNVASLNPATQSGFYDAQTPADGPQGAVWTHMIRSMHTGGATTNQWSLDISAPFTGGTGLGSEGYYVRTIAAGTVGAWRQLWHSGNLTNLGQLTNTPGFVTNATVANVDVTEHSSNNTNYPLVWDNGARSLFHTAAKLWFNPSSGLLAAVALAAGTTLSWPGASFRDYTDTNYTALYGALAGTPGSSNYTFAIAKNGSEVYVAGSSNANLVVGSTIIARATSAGLAVTGALSATTTLGWGAGAAIGSSDNVVQGYNGSGSSSVSGSVAMSTWRRSGFYAFSTPTDAPNSSNNWTHLIHSQGADWASGSHYTFQIASSFSGGSNQSWGSEIYAMRVVTGGTPQPWRRLFFDRGGIIDTGTQLDFVPAGGTTYGMRITRSSGNPYVAFPFGFTATGVSINTATFGSDGYNPAISSPDAAIGGMKQVASRFWSTSSVLPVMAANTWCFLVCDFTGGTNVMWTTNSSQTVSIRSGGATYTTAVNSTLTDGGANFFCNYRTMILVGPTVSTSSQCSVIVW